MARTFGECDEEKPLSFEVHILCFLFFQVYEKGQNAKHLKREPKLDKPGPGALKYYDSVKVNHPYLKNNLIQSSKTELYSRCRKHYTSFLLMRTP